MAAAGRPRSGSPSQGRAGLEDRRERPDPEEVHGGPGRPGRLGRRYSAEQLVDAYGFTLEEANLFKCALGEVPSITAAVDALAFLSQTWGA